jgi:hypothetical protein
LPRTLLDEDADDEDDADGMESSISNQCDNTDRNSAHSMEPDI